MDEALTEAEQFVWGGAEAAQAAELTVSLRRVRRWASRVSAATKTKPTMALLRPLLAADPPPMQHPGAPPPCAWRSPRDASEVTCSEGSYCTCSINP